MLENFGFIHEKVEVKVLILFIMRRLSEPVTLDVLMGLTLCDDGISYFDVTECLGNLIETKHLQLTDDKYSLTSKGIRNGEALEENLPYSVRAKAETATTLVRIKLNREAMINTKYDANEYGGYNVTMSLSDGIGEIISMELHTTNEQQAKKIDKNFKNNAEQIYLSIMEMLVK